MIIKEPTLEVSGFPLVLIFGVILPSTSSTAVAPASTHALPCSTESVPAVSVITGLVASTVLALVLLSSEPPPPPQADSTSALNSVIQVSLMMGCFFIAKSSLVELVFLTGHYIKNWIKSKFALSNMK